ncbi:hypothetical protein SE17_26405, partial [Kouleothrix aurantiaca]
QLLRDAASPAAGYAPLDPAASYSVATSDFQGKVAGGYKDIFAPAPVRDTGIADLRDVVRDYIKNHSPVSAQRDGRMTQGSAEPATLPRTGGASLKVGWLGVLGALFVALGWAGRRRSRVQR